MTDEPAAPTSPDLGPPPGPAPAPASEPTNRVRIDPPATSRRRDGWPILYLVGFIVLAGALFYLWRNPPSAKMEQQDADLVRTLQAQVATLQNTVATLQKQPSVAPDQLDRLRQQVDTLAARPAGPSAADLQALQTRLAAVESRPATPPTDLSALQQQIKSLNDQMADLSKLGGRVDALEKRPTLDQSALDTRFNDFNARIDQAGKQLDAKLQDLQSKADSQAQSVQAKLQSEQQALQSKIDADAQAVTAKLQSQQQSVQAKLDDLEKQQKAVAAKAQLAARLQGLSASLAAGQKLGTVPGAPPALARFADQPPPTEGALHASFEHYATAAQQANLSVSPDNQSFVAGLWSRAQRAVTVRQGEHVIVGDPIAGVLAQARDQLDTGSLQGAIAALKTLTGPAAQAMQPWIDQAQALLDARAAIAQLAAN